MYEVLTIGDIVIPGGPFLPGPLVLPTPAPGAPPAVPPLIVPPSPAPSPSSSAKSVSAATMVAGGVAIFAAGVLATWFVMRR